MKRSHWIRGFVVMASGWLGMGLASRLDRGEMLGGATDFTTGLLHGLSAVAVIAGIVLLTRGWRTTRDRGA